MKPAELQDLLQTVPGGVDVVVGNADTGVYFEPGLMHLKSVRLWKLVQENPTAGPNYVTYFATRVQGEREQSASSLKCLRFYEVECLRL